jgi:DNA polymerase I-like protein with 3'-5' exonuclease and polymerase domains
LYNPDSKSIITDIYNRDKLLEKWYNDGYIRTPFGREIEVEERKAFNYLIQSTTSDIVLDRAVAIDKMLEGTKSFISHIVHDEIVLDMTDEDRKLIPDIKEVFAMNSLGKYLVNLNAGKNYLDLKELKL